MIDSGTWCGVALTSLFSLWREEENFAWRNSRDLGEYNGGVAKYRPTATFHAITAFGECGVWDAASEIKNNSLKTPFFEAQNVHAIPPPREVLRTLVCPPEVESPPSPPTSASWVEHRLDQSSHTSKPKGSQGRGPTFQQSLVLGGLFQALRVLLSAGALGEAGEAGPAASPPSAPPEPVSSPPQLDELAERVSDGFRVATDRLLSLALAKDDEEAGHVKESLPDDQPRSRRPRLLTETELFENEEVSTNLLLHLAIALHERGRILKGAARWGLRLERDTEELSEQLKSFEKSLSGFFHRQADRLMARLHVPADPQYDPTSLAFAMRGLTLLDESARAAPLFRAYAQAVADGQNADGCWPDGVSVTYSPDGNIIQQPSVDVALCLAQSVYHHELLINHDAGQIELLNIGIKALEKTAGYLAASYNPPRNGFSGWVSDRVRRVGISETWITALTARLFYTMYLAERALSRAATLGKYGVRPAKRARASDSDPGEAPAAKSWLDDIKEPDAVLRPAEQLLKKVVVPLEGQRQRGLPVLRPGKNGVSFIIYGPPGSGKTYAIERLAAALRWPLLTLTPGHFIKNGLELIEATAAGIFADLMRLDHTVVFFDECDELFRERSTQSAEGRNILSFATASMLPKLQDLHDARRVIFFLGTNFLSNIDTAVRRSGRFDERLLLDRPDAGGRRELLKTGWKEMPEELIAQAVKDTTGWMSKDVVDFAKKVKDKSKPPAAGGGASQPWNNDDLLFGKVTIPDYIEWCAKAGKEELEAAGLGKKDDEFWGVCLRWAKDFGEAYFSEFRSHHRDSLGSMSEDNSSFLVRLEDKVDRSVQTQRRG